MTDEELLLGDTIKRAEEASKKAGMIERVLSQSGYANELKMWGIAYWMLGDKEAGEILFDKALQTLDSYIDGRACPTVKSESYWWGLESEQSELYDAYQFKEETLFVKNLREGQESPLKSLTRGQITQISVDDLYKLGGMNQYFQPLRDLKSIEEGKPTFLFHPNFMFAIKNEGVPFRHRVFQEQPLPPEIVEKAKALFQSYRGYSERWDTIPVERKIKFLIDWADIVKQVYTIYVDRLVKP